MNRPAPAARSRSVLGRALPVTLLAVALAGCGAEGQDQEGEGGFERVINVEVRTVEPRPFTEIARISGTVQANQDVEVAAEEGGVVRELPVSQGTRVSAGDPIARIDASMLEAQVREAEARASLARETWDRRRRLFEEDGVGSELAYLEARAQAQEAEAQLETLQERLDRTVVRAPVSGVLETRRVEVGSMVAGGAPVARIVQVDPVKITGGVPERFAADIGPGAPARVSFDVLRGEVFEGRLDYVGSTVNPSNRTFPVELVLANPGRVIKPEMVATLEITRRRLEDAVVIPQEVVIRDEEGYVAFVAVERNGEEVAESRRLVLGGSQRNEVVVEEGVVAGDRLITVGQNQVADGDRIRIVGAGEENR